LPELAPHEVALLMHPNSSCAGRFVRVEVFVARNVDSVCVCECVVCCVCACCVALCVVCVWVGARVCRAETYAMYAHQFAHQY
jgi:hypothetical protein